MPNRHDKIHLMEEMAAISPIQAMFVTKILVTAQLNCCCWKSCIVSQLKVLKVLNPPQSPVVRNKSVRGEIFDLFAKAKVIAIIIAAEILARKVPIGSERLPILNGRPMTYLRTEPIPPPAKMSASVTPFIF